jgi:transposase
MYIHYSMGQLHLPMDLEMDIPANHLVRVVNEAVNRLSDATFDAAYPGGGRDSYHPKMLTKVIIYAYTQRIYSSRQIAKAVRETVPFMWIAGRQTPDFRTINRFRSERMKDVLQMVFTAVLELLVTEGYVKLENYFVDGTKIEANANRYSFVWGKAVVKHKARLQEKVKTLFESIEDLERAEGQEHNNQDLAELGESTELTAEKLTAAVERLEVRLQEKPTAKPIKRIVRQIRRDYLGRLKRYEEQQAILGERNSYSKTDPDATFMRMKEDHMRNGQLKPGYNVQVGTENQFIVGYTLHQRPTDTRCLIPHLEQVTPTLSKKLQKVVADAGYGGEENYAYLERENLVPLVKYNTFHKEQSKAWINDASNLENWTYEEAEDVWICPNGQRLTFHRERNGKTSSGYTTRLRYYRSPDCDGCPFKEQCTQAVGNREIRVSMPYLRFKQQAKAHLLSEDGRQLSVRRMTEVESVFGQIKNNRGFRRFLLRGLPKVSLEVGWLSLAHNLMKKAAVQMTRQPVGVS